MYWYNVPAHRLERSLALTHLIEFHLINLTNRSNNIYIKKQCGARYNVPSSIHIHILLSEHQLHYTCTVKLVM